MARNFFKPRYSRPYVAPKVEPLPPEQALGSKKAYLASLMNKAGVIDEIIAKRLPQMELAEVVSQIEKYKHVVEGPKGQLLGLVKIAYAIGALDTDDFHRDTAWIHRLEAKHFDNQIAYYKRLIASKETSKAA